MTVNYSKLSDGALFDLYCKGDLAAFDCYYEKMSPKIWGFVKKRIQSTAHAEDIYQEVWLKIHRSREQYDPKYPVNPWVFTIVRSVLYDGLRVVQRNKEHLVEEEVMDQKIAQASMENDKKSSAPDWDHGLGNLTAEQKNMIELRYLKDWSFGEIAKSLGLSEDNTRQKISRIVKKLRGRFA